MLTCGPTPDVAAPAKINVPDIPLDGPRALLRDCTGGVSFMPRPTEPWRRVVSSVTARGELSHALHDVATVRGRQIDFFAHVTYGVFERELAGEAVELYIHNCEGGFELLSRAVTTRRGEARFVLQEQDAPLHGEYDLRLRVVGDNTFVGGTLRVLPAGTRFVVMDLDHVLTGDRVSQFRDAISDYFEPLGLGSLTQTPRPGAVALTQLYAKQGYEILYLSARPHELTSISRAWLAEHGFAPGTLWFADDSASFRASNVTSYKRAVLRRLIERGYRFDVAYAGVQEDADAYASVGLEKIVRVEDGELEAHVESLDEAFRVMQPFDRAQ